MLSLAVGSPAWFDWLATISSFSFSSQHGACCTVRKEPAQRGGWYWSAYRRQGQKMVKHYLGHDANLTVARLEEAALLLSPDRHPSAIGNDPPSWDQDLLRAPDRSAHSIRATVVAGIPHDDLLETKFQLPQPPSALLSRPYLIEQVQAGLPHALTLICAPAGFGKTTALLTWVKAHPEQRTAWVSLDRFDNDPNQFWTYALSALQRICPQVGNAALTLLRSPQSPPLSAVLRLLLNALASVQEKLVLVLDDYHLITAASVHQTLSTVLEHQPTSLHLILLTRQQPPLPLARLRAQGHLYEIGPEELRFRLDEAVQFFQEKGLSLPKESLLSLLERTEGWIVGLQLAALSLQDQRDPVHFVQTFSGKHRHVLAYLSEEVLARQPVEVQQFLLATSILNRLSPPLCEAVTNQGGAQVMLEGLVRANLFLTPLDHEDYWYRYHPLFADLLRVRLNRQRGEEIALFHRRAARWYCQAGMMAEAIRHFLIVGDAQEAAEVIEQEVYRMLRSNACAHLLRLLDQLPELVVLEHPRLCLARACCLLIIGQREAAASLLHVVEQAGKRLPVLDLEADEMQTSEQRLMRTDVAFFHVILAGISAVRGDTAIVVDQAHRALRLLPQEEDLLRGCVLLSLGIAERLQGSTVSAVKTLAQASRLCFAAAFPQVAIAALTQQASLLVMQGHLHQAAAVYRYALHVASEHGDGAFASLGEVYVDLGRLLYEWNDLEAVLDVTRRGIICGQQWELVEDQIDGAALTVQVLLAQGRNREATATLHQADVLFQQTAISTGMSARMTAIRACVAWHQGQAEQAARWMQESELSATSYTPHSADFRHEFTYLTLVRILLSQSRLEEAAGLLAQLLPGAQAEARTGSVIEIFSLQALVLSAQGRLAEALGILTQALSLAASEGYIRLFIDSGEPMRTLLLHLHKQQTQRPTTLLHYIDTLLAAFASPQQEIPRLVEPLSQREREILHLMAQGLSNQQMAQQLVIAMSTVKTHIHHLFGKLAVRSRLQAVSRAKELGLLG